MTLPDSSLGQTIIEYVEAPYIKAAGEIQQVAHKPSWMDPCIKYISEGTLPENRVEASLLKWRVARFMLMDG